MKTFCGSLLVFVMSVQGLLLSSALHANSKTNPTTHHSNHTKVEPDIFWDSYYFCKKQIPNSEEGTIDTVLTVLSKLIFETYVIDKLGIERAVFGGTASSVVRDLAKLPSTAYKVYYGIKKGSTEEVWSEGHLWSQCVKVAIKTSFMAVGYLNKKDTIDWDQLEGRKDLAKEIARLSKASNYPGELSAQTFGISGKNYQKDLKNGEIEGDVSFISYYFSNLNPSLVVTVVFSVFPKLGIADYMSSLLIVKYKMEEKIRWIVCDGLSNLALLLAYGLMPDGTVGYYRNNLETYMAPALGLGLKVLSLYVENYITSLILITTSQIGFNAPVAIWNYEHPIKDDIKASIKENFEYYRDLANDYILVPMSSFQASESLSDDDDYASDL